MKLQLSIIALVALATVSFLTPAFADASFTYNEQSGEIVYDLTDDSTCISSLTLTVKDASGTTTSTDNVDSLLDNYIDSNTCELTFSFDQLYTLVQAGSTEILSMSIVTGGSEILQLDNENVNKADQKLDWDSDSTVCSSNRELISIRADGYSYCDSSNVKFSSFDTLTIETPPSSGLTLYVGSDIDFKGTDTITEKSQTTYIWKIFDSSSTQVGSGIGATRSSGETSLNTVSKSIDTAGSYTVTLTPTASDDRRSTSSSFTVVEKPDITLAITSPADNSTFEVGDSIALKAEYSGDDWKTNNYYVFNWVFSATFSNGQTYSGYYDDTDDTDKYGTYTLDTTGFKPGTYTILVKNIYYSTSVDSDSITFTLATSTAATSTTPGQPTNFSATPGDTIVVLDWDAPSNGGSPITDYTIKVNDGTSWVTFADGTSTTTTATVPNLTNDHQYAFSVLAVNANGDGTTSEVKTATPTGTQSLAIISPADNASFVVGETMNLTTQFINWDGVSWLDLDIYADAKDYDTSNTWTFFNWSTMTDGQSSTDTFTQSSFTKLAGTYTITASGYTGGDNTAAVKSVTPATLTYTVNGVLDITSPSDNSSFTDSDKIQLTGTDTAVVKNHDYVWTITKTNDSTVLHTIQDNDLDDESFELYKLDTGVYDLYLTTYDDYSGNTRTEMKTFIVTSSSNASSSSVSVDITSPCDDCVYSSNDWIDFKANIFSNSTEITTPYKITWYDEWVNEDGDTISNTYTEFGSNDDALGGTKIGEHALTFSYESSSTSGVVAIDSITFNVKVVEEVTETKKSGGGCNDCKSPTIGLDAHGKRFVNAGLILNGEVYNVEYYKTHMPMQNTTIYYTNNATFKVYENGGIYNIENFQLGLGVKEIGTPINEAQARIEVYPDRYAYQTDSVGVEEIKVIDPDNIINDVEVNLSIVDCGVIADPCLGVEVLWSYAKAPTYDVLMTNVYDFKKNTINDYFNDGLYVHRPLVVDDTPEPYKYECKDTPLDEVTGPVTRNNCHFREQLPWFWKVPE